MKVSSHTQATKNGRFSITRSSRGGERVIVSLKVTVLPSFIWVSVSQNGVFLFEQTSNAKIDPDSSSGGAWQFLCTSKHVITSIFPKSTREFSSQSTYYGAKFNANLISISLRHPIQIPPVTSHFLAIAGVISQPSNKERPFFDPSVLERGGARYRFRPLGLKFSPRFFLFKIPFLSPKTHCGLHSHLSSPNFIEFGAKTSELRQFEIRAGFECRNSYVVG